MNVIKKLIIFYEYMINTCVTISNATSSVIDTWFKSVITKYI